MSPTRRIWFGAGGRITDEGLGCVTLRDEDQYVYALYGEVARLAPGDQVVVEGTVILDGACGGVDGIGVARWYLGG